MVLLYNKVIQASLNMINKLKFKEYSLVLGYFTALFSTTCFFFNPHKVIIFGAVVQVPIALTFFPLTFALSNIVQTLYGREAAKSLFFCAFLFDTLLVFGSLFLSYLGDRSDYRSVFKDMPTIMISTWFFMGIGSIFNISLYSWLNKKPAKNLAIHVVRFFITITATELLTSLMSMPLMFYKHGLEGNLLISIAISVLYKLTANIIITFVYVVTSKKLYKG